MKYVFQLWGRDTKTVMKDFIELGFKAVVVAVQADKISKDWVGRIIDKDFLKDLPKGVDWSGENGDRKSTRLNSSHVAISYAVFCLKKKNNETQYLIYSKMHS